MRRSEGVCEGGGGAGSENELDFDALSEVYFDKSGYKFNKFLIFFLENVELLFSKRCEGFVWFVGGEGLDCIFFGMKMFDA